LTKKLNILKILGLLIFISSPFVLFSSHLVGGKISYKYLGSNKYEITLSVYRDCSVTTPFDNPAFISIYNKSNNTLVYNKGLALNSQSTIPISLPNPCFAPPPGICLEIGNYIDTVSLAPNSLGYTIVYQKCCRNATLLNLITPQTNGTSITNDIPPQINNTPKFTNFPPIFICLTDTFNYSFACTDTDGDILKYKLCDPYFGASFAISTPNPASPPPYLPVIWSSTFSATNPIPNSGGITLNQNTGHLKFKPSMTGQFAICVCVEEFRNNQLINTNRLELQFNIVNCYLTSSIPTASNLCQGLTIPFQNSSTNANSFHWNFGDLTTLSDTSNLFAPSYTFPNYGTYTVMLTVYNTAYGFCKDSMKKVINVNPLLSPTLQSTYSSCFKNNNFNFNVGGSFHPSASFNWNFTTNSNSTNTNANPTNANFTTPTPKTVSVVVNQFGCKDTLFASVTFTNPIASINDFNLNCNEKNLVFTNSSNNSNSFLWNFGDLTSSNDTSSQISPTYNYPSYGNYTVSLIAYSGVCSDTNKLVIKVFPKLQLNWISNVQKQCLKNNSFNFVPTGTWGSNATFNWLFYNLPNPITSTQQNPSNIQFTNSGYHLIKYSVSENGCTKNAQAAVLVHPDPKAIQLLSDTIGCEPLTVKFKQEPHPTHPVQAYWTINSNSFTSDSLIYTFNNSGLYSYNLVVTDTNNCFDTVSKINYIKVNTTPKALHYANPLQTSILNSQVTFIDSTNSSHFTNFNFGDGATSTQTINNHFYASSGQFNYSLIASNQFGCADTVSGIIIIDDIPSNYVPNIFTPNNDNVNEVFFIKGESITKSSMIIFNRWGTKVFETDDALKGWNGINQNNGNLCADGTYFYIISITLNNKTPYTFKGNVTLIK
jgi:gliding motility-associated-like protein